MSTPNTSNLAMTDDICIVSGQVSMDESFNVMCSGDIAGQTRVAFQRLEKILKEEGMTLDNVIAVTVYLTDGELFGEFNSAWREVFAHPRPARTTVGAKVFLDGALIEVSAIASRRKSRLQA